MTRRMQPAPRRAGRFGPISALAALLLLVVIATQVNWQFVTTLHFGVLATYAVPLLRGALVTLEITGACLLIGFAAGLSFAILLRLPIGPVRWLIAGYVELWRNTPLLVQLFWIHFGMPSLLGISTTALQSGTIALSLQSSAYLADIARAGIRAVPQTQWEAGRALGLPTLSLWGDVVLPQALRMMVPAIANLSLSFVNGSALLGLLQVGELMTVARRVSDYTFQPIEVMTAVGFIYLALNTIIAQFARRLEHALGVGN